MAKYKNVPLLPEVHSQLQAIANANNRGLGDQVKAWVERELPDCEHEKQSVVVELFGELQLGQAVRRPGWYCPICKRVYERREPLNVLNVSDLDPYGQPQPVQPTKKHRAQRVGRDF
jgi:hypothetical protein